MRRNLPVVFAGGAFGGFVEALLFYIFSLTGIVEMFGMPVAPGWRPEMIYRPVVHIHSVKDGRLYAPGFKRAAAGHYFKCLLGHSYGFDDKIF